MKKTKVLSIVSLIAVLGLISFVFNLGLGNTAKAATNASLTLSPTTGNLGVSGTMTINILLNTGGTPVDSVDIYKLHFNPAILQVVDSDGGTTGTQIAVGSLFPNTVVNTVDNSGGTIQFSQSASGGTSFTGSGTLATITFIGAGGGTSAVTFDFTLNSTVDTNAAYQGVDQLGSVNSASITVDATSPSVPAGLSATAVSTSQINLAWTASTDNVGVTGYKIFRAGSQINTSATNSYSDTGLTAATLYSYNVSAFDAAGNNSAQSTAASATTQAGFNFTMSNGGAKSVNQASQVTNTITSTLSSGTTTAVSFSTSGLPSGASASYSPTTCSPTCTTTMTITTGAGTPTGTSSITVTGTAGAVVKTTAFNLTVNTISYSRTMSLASLDGRTSSAISGTIDVLTNPAKTFIKSYAYTTNAAGSATVTFDIPTQLAYIQVHASPFLTRLISQDLSLTTGYAFPQLFIGDINQDNIINSIDYSVLNSNWFTTNASGDLNVDGLVNSIDFSFMNKHWLTSGEQ